MGERGRRPPEAHTFPPIATEFAENGRRRQDRNLLGPSSVGSSAPRRVFMGLTTTTANGLRSHLATEEARKPSPGAYTSVERILIALVERQDRLEAFARYLP